jgi:poly(3-hydroxybutyrate) depolymerase|tara:strand:- start:1128 stop:1976 length:849 start_codon:yes stop_codon:yes gene_type:complete
MKNILLKLLVVLSFGSCNENTPNDNIDSNGYSVSNKTILIEQSLDNNNLITRPVIMQTPNVIDTSKSYPIVFAFHGRGGNNNSWVNHLINYTNSGEFIGIYPQGYLESWNLGPEPSNANDVEFINLIVDELQNYDNLNFDKMYAIGTSNGSGMVNKLAIETNHFKAIAPIASQLIESLPLLNSTNPVSVLQVNGAADTTIPIDGGPRLGHIFLDAYESAELWATKFNCSQNPNIIMLGQDTLYVFDSCENEKEIRYLRIEDGEHNLPLHILFQDVWAFFQRF